MFMKTIAKIILGLALLIPASALLGCASTGAERPEGFTGQSASHATSSGGSTRFEWGGKGMQYGHVVRD